MYQWGKYRLYPSIINNVQVELVVAISNMGAGETTGNDRHASEYDLDSGEGKARILVNGDIFVS